MKMLLFLIMLVVEGLLIRLNVLAANYWTLIQMPGEECVAYALASIILGLVTIGFAVVLVAEEFERKPR